ncbi:helix-turn-helix domain-containing protein [Flagellimonas baculiformis]|uniref:helix-turn-helix domain-containing protein n=1 Tax=Flagellimonas baculiformis TaxID=3067310 RepID=UPI00296F29F5|nr:AraC family transcriptional regulator [Muricauda sp. D6]
MKNDIVILVLCSLGIAQGIFLCFYLLTLKKGNRLAHRFLVLVILGLILRIGKSILNVHMDLEAWQRNLGIAGILLVGPSLWLYGETLFKKRKELNWTSYLHFLPYLLFTLLSWAIPNRGDALSYFIYDGVFVHLLVYLGLAIRLLAKNSQSVQPKIHQWYRNLVIGVGLIWAFYIGNIAGLIPFYIGGALFFTLLVYMFSFLLLRNHTFSLEKYPASHIDTSLSKNLLDSIVSLFETEEIYLNPKLSLGDVARSLETSPRILSQVVNEGKGMNFSEFVNSYRIEKAKKLLVSSVGKEEKIVSIAYDSGFGNVTSFNLAFKSFTNLTPSQYKKQYRLS